MKMVKNGSAGESARWLFWFFMVNAFACAGIALLYLRTANIGNDLPTRLFLMLSFPAHFVTLALVPLALLLVLVIFQQNSRFLTTTSVLLGTAALTILVVDTAVYSLYRFHLNGMVWNLITSGVASEVLSLTRATWVTFLGLVAVILAAETAIARFLLRYSARLPRILPFSLILLITILSAHTLHAWADFVQHVPITRETRLLPAYKPLTAKRLMSQLGFEPASRATLRSDNGGGSLRYPLEELRFSPPKRPLNLLLIVIDSWRYDMLTPEDAPNIFRYSADSWVFENHHSSGNCTRFGFFSLFYGLYGTYWHAFLAEQKGPVLIGELKKRGYGMGIYASAPLTNPEFDRTVFVDVRDRISVKEEGKRPLDRDIAITGRMQKFLAAQNGTKPFFGMLFYDAIHAKQFSPEFAVHKPYLEQINYLALGKGQDRLPILNTYKNALRFVDNEVGKVLEALRNRDLQDDTIVVITGDHGEELNDLGLNYWGHNSNFAKYQVRTPLIVKIPGRKAERFSHATTHLDLAPTMMQQLFGCSTPPSSYSNGSVLTDSARRPFIHVSTWDSFAMVEQDRICIVENKGGTEIVDSRYLPLKEATVDPATSRTALDGMSRFYGH